MHDERWEFSSAAVVIEAGSVLAATWLVLKNSYPTTIYKVVSFEWAPAVHWVSLLLVGAALAVGAVAVFSGRPESFLRSLSKAWSPLLANLPVVARAAFQLEPFYLEGLLIAVSTGGALAASLSMYIAASPRDDRQGKHLWLVATLAAALIAGSWFYAVQERFLHQRRYGWRDAGLYYARVKNTALGEGLLVETPAHRPFYDHFGPGLAALAPAWWLWPSYRLMMAAQAAALAFMGPAVYLYARGRGATGVVAFLLGAAALVHPSISQMAYSFSYGFHPITLAMPLVALSIYLWESRRWWLFAAAALAAVSMEETVLPLYAGLGAVSWLWEAKGSWTIRARHAGLVVAAAAVIVFLVITKAIMPAFAGQEYFQIAKYTHLGDSFVEVLLSPIFEARVFWGLLLSQRSLVFSVLLLGSVGFLPLVSLRRLAYALIIFVFVMILEDDNVKSISFWYQALLVAAWLPAMAAGTMALPRQWRQAAATGALFCALAASHFYGLLPISRVTMPWQASPTESTLQVTRELMHIAGRTPRDARVVATMREAMLFADCRLTPVNEWQADDEPDLAVFDMQSTWGQQPHQTRAAFEALVSTGLYEIEPLEGVVLLRRRAGP